MKYFSLTTMLLSTLISLPTPISAFENPCFLHPWGSIQNITGHNCPSAAPWLTTQVGYRCETCGDLGNLETITVTGYGACLAGTPACLPSLTSIDYQAQSVSVTIQNRRLFVICLRTDSNIGTATCICPPSCGTSPILISLEDQAIRLTSAEMGVLFDLDADGSPDQTAWTQVSSDEGFLALDRNENGVVDDGTELFGDHTPQPIPPDGDERNGFAALAVFDDTLSGGNEDGLIDARDSIFSSLRLWVDSNHNGYSEPEELLTLPEGDVVSIDLDYRQSRRTDRHGNAFRYRSKVKMQGRTAIAWDVFFVQQE